MYPASSFVTGEENRRQLEKSLDMWEQRCLAMVEGHGTAVCNVMMQLVEKRINEWEAGAVVNWETEPLPTLLQLYASSSSSFLWQPRPDERAPWVDDKMPAAAAPAPARSAASAAANAPAALASTRALAPAPAPAPASIPAPPAWRPSSTAPNDGHGPMRSPNPSRSTSPYPATAPDATDIACTSAAAPAATPAAAAPAAASIPATADAAKPVAPAENDKHRCSICRRTFASNNKLHEHLRSGHRPRWPPRPPAGPPPPPPPAGPSAVHTRPPLLSSPRMEPPPPWWMLPPPPPPPIHPPPTPKPTSLTWRRAGHFELPVPKKTKLDTEFPRRRLQELNVELTDIARRAIARAAAAPRQ